MHLAYILNTDMIVFAYQLCLWKDGKQKKGVGMKSTEIFKSIFFPLITQICKHYVLYIYYI